MTMKPMTNAQLGELPSHTGNMGMRSTGVHLNTCYNSDLPGHCLSPATAYFTTQAKLGNTLGPDAANDQSATATTANKFVPTTGKKIQLGHDEQTQKNLDQQAQGKAQHQTRAPQALPNLDYKM